MIAQVTIKNFKSIREQTLNLGAINVFIGANGSGKSNLIGVFLFFLELIRERHAGSGIEDISIANGGADNLLYYGRRTSGRMSFDVTSAPSPERPAPGTCSIRLRSTNANSLFWENRTILNTFDLYNFLGEGRVYHFQDTTTNAPMRTLCDVEDNRSLRPQAENLAAFLYWLQEKKPGYFSNIQDAIRQIAPFFGKFNLAPSRLNESKIRLEWMEKGSDAYFNASALSDGTLRFICLATLLLQPEPPPLILLDEPELGLHPAAINLLAALLQSAATRTQIIVATQSVTLVDQFTPEAVWTVDREDNQSVFRHLARQDLSAWLDGYSLGELWQKNVLGGRP
jgi:predicted ATPase